MARLESSDDENVVDPDFVNSFLAGIRVLEIGSELGEYCGKVLAGLGADVVKIEPPTGEITRSYGPFYRDVPGPNNSLYFWHYNFGKRGVTLDLDSPSGITSFEDLVLDADVIIDSRPKNYLEQRGLNYDSLRGRNPSLIYARISPFGDDGPWVDFKGGDLVHLALGGVMMNCGYDPDPFDVYDTPPIAPQMWQAYHIAGEMAAISVVAALNYRHETGIGQRLSISVHEAVSKNTETDLPNWIFLRQTHRRQTARHSRPHIDVPSISLTKDGRWLLPYRTYLRGDVESFGRTVALLKSYGMQADLEDEKYQDVAYRSTPEVARYVGRLVDALVNKLKYDHDLWREAQTRLLPWAPVRKPEENLRDPHFDARETFFDVEHPELGRSFSYVGAKWFAPEVPWPRGPRAPLLGEHNEEILRPAAKPVRPPRSAAAAPTGSEPVLSPHGKPFALTGVRIIDLSWLLASAGSGRFFTSLGAEVIKVEHESKPDTMRWGIGVVPDGGREQRDRATEAIPTPVDYDSPNRSGSFMEINAGKLGISLNLKHPRGRELLTELLAGADMVVEGFSAGTMDRMGFGYDRLREINPRLIYVQQSGLGQHGRYAGLRTYGPSAAAFAGLTEMSGLAEPYPPAGIGYSYLDWFGAYNMALAMMAALFRQRRTGLGCYIDSSQVESGIYLTGTAILDYTANGRPWHRTANRSPHKPAAPHGVYPTLGVDRWIAVACFDEAQWSGLVDVLGLSAVRDDPRFATQADRLLHQDELDEVLARATVAREGFELMYELQRSGTPAGVCQNAQDRYEDDPQLRHLDWLVELRQTDIGTWPVKEIPVKYSETPPYIGGRLDRSGPSYGEDNAYVYGQVLGLSAAEIGELRDQGVI